MIPRFRAWLKNDKEMIDVDEIHFYNGQLDFIGDAITFMRKADEIELMQSTGLEDKNDQEIFEGDIVIDYQGTFFEVKRAEGYAGFFLYPYDPEDLMTFYPGIELTIIGNIYEDSGLMEDDYGRD